MSFWIAVMTRIRYIEPPERRRVGIRETLRLLVGYALAALVMWVVFYNGPAKADDHFYQPESGELAGPPGSIIRSEAMPFAPEGASALRILYRSLGLHGEPIAVSGILIKPDIGSDE